MFISCCPAGAGLGRIEVLSSEHLPKTLANSAKRMKVTYRKMEDATDTQGESLRLALLGGGGLLLAGALILFVVTRNKGA